MSQVKSRQRVTDHGEVFTPACGSVNFLVPILRRKLAAVELRYGKSEFERRHYALLALMCIYGIELLVDNIAECRANVLEILAEYLNLNESDELYRADEIALINSMIRPMGEADE